MGGGAQHDLLDRHLVEAAVVQRLARCDLTRRAREVVAAFGTEAKLAVDELDDERSAVVREMVRLALCRLPGYAA